jgi:hypothetical protein
VVLPTNIYCNHDDKEASANCTHGDVLQVNHWSCCGGRDYAEPCKGVPPPRGPGGEGHAGQWREMKGAVVDGATGAELLKSNLCCNFRGLPLAGEDHGAFCTHDVENNELVLRVNHWSCCGGRDYKEPCRGGSFPSLGPGGTGHAGQWREVQGSPAMVRDGATGDMVILRPSRYCNLDGKEASANCTHGDVLHVNHWSCCGGRDYFKPCEGIPPPPPPLGPGGTGHTGQWRHSDSSRVIDGATGNELLRSNLCCNIEGLEGTGPDHGAFCTHGEFVVIDNHWSCCGAKEYLAPCGPNDDNVHLQLQMEALTEDCRTQ